MEKWESLKFGSLRSIQTQLPVPSRRQLHLQQSGWSPSVIIVVVIVCTVHLNPESMLQYGHAMRRGNMHRFDVRLSLARIWLVALNQTKRRPQLFGTLVHGPAAAPIPTLSPTSQFVAVCVLPVVRYQKALSASSFLCWIISLLLSSADIP